MPVIRIGNDYFNTETGNLIRSHAEMVAEIERSGQVGIKADEEAVDPKGTKYTVVGSTLKGTLTPRRGAVSFADAVKAYETAVARGASEEAGPDGLSEAHNILRELVGVGGRGVKATEDFIEGKEQNILYGVAPETTVADTSQASTDTSSSTSGGTSNSNVEKLISVMGDELRLTTGIEERKLDASTAAQAAQQAYNYARLNFETEDAARNAGLNAAKLLIQSRDLNRRFGLDVGQFLMSARGPQNYGQLFNIYGGQPATAGGLPTRLLNAVTGAGPVGLTPSTGVPAGTQLGFGDMLRQLYSGGGVVPPGAALGQAIAGAPGGAVVPGAGAPVVPGAPAPDPRFGVDGQTPARPGFSLDPRNVNPVQFNRLLRTEPQAAFSLFESAGFPAIDVAQILNRALPQAGRLAQPRLGTAGLRV